MVSTESIEQYQRLISEKHSRLQSGIDSLIAVFVGEAEEAKIKNVESCLKSSVSLADLFANKDKPGWLKKLQTDLNRYSQGTIKRNALMMTIIEVHNALNNFNFNNSSKKKGIDFDSIFQNAVEESQLPKLFDEIIELLTKIKDSGEIDSQSMINALEDLLANLRVSKKGSWLSIYGTKQFLAEFIKNYAHELAIDSPIIGNMYKAFRTTSDNFSVEVEKVNDHTRELFEAEIKTAIEKPNFKQNIELENHYKEILSLQLDVGPLQITTDTQPKLDSPSKQSNNKQSSK